MKEVKRGDRVSLVKTRRAYFFQTVGGISLSADLEDSAIIPETATDGHLKQINLAIDNGHLVMGDPSRDCIRKFIIDV